MIQTYGSKPTRDGFGEGLVELGTKREDIVVLSADLTESTRAAWFKEKMSDEKKHLRALADAILTY